MQALRFAVPFAATVVLAGCGGSAPPPAPTTPAAPASAAAPAKEGQTGTTNAALKAPGEATVGDRSTCPISGEEFTITASSPKFDYKGKTYYFCCGGCDAKFSKDPEKYLQKKPGA